MTSNERSDSIFACVVAIMLFLLGCLAGAQVGYSVGTPTDADVREAVLTLQATTAKSSDNPRSPHWPAVRDAWLEKHPTCAACGTDEHCEVHHVKPFSYYPELELE